MYDKGTHNLILQGQYKILKVLLKIFSSKEIRQALKFNYFKNGLLKIDSTNHLIRELLPIEKIEDIPKPIWVSAYDLKKKELHYFNSGNTLTLCNLKV